MSNLPNLTFDAIKNILRDLGNTMRRIAISRDATNRKMLELELRISAISFEAQEGMIIADKDFTILRVNRAFTESTGYSVIEAIGNTPKLIRSDRHPSEFYVEMWHQVMENGYWSGEIYVKRKNSEVFPIWLTLTAVKNEDGIITNYVCTQTDITKRKSAEKEIKHLAFYDSLTELGNRRLLMDRLQQTLTLSRENSSRGALIFIDLDNFKTLNDTAGHEIGDLLLKQVASRLLDCVREGDTVARLGGDEFVVILPELNLQNDDVAHLAAQAGARILSALNESYFLAGADHFSSPSIGVALFGMGNETVAELLRRADLAMYQAKASGRNSLSFFDPSMQIAITARAELESAMRQGLHNDEFIVYYQPQIDSEGKLLGAEALVRWQHPQRGILSPNEFIPLAEESGLIFQLGIVILEKACLELVHFAKINEQVDFTISVNVSARQFHQHDFVAEVLNTIQRTGADPCRLKLELTESLLLDNVDETIAKIASLKEHGIGFSLDDFGIGYSSLSYLKRLPLDQLKIDQSFVRNILTDHNDAAIAKMIIALGQSMGLDVIAEGVETNEQRNFLALIGCEAFQGYLFGRPMTAMAFETFVLNMCGADRSVVCGALP